MTDLYGVRVLNVEPDHLASNPDGTYLVVAGASRKRPYVNVADGFSEELCVWRMADKKIIMGRQLTTAVEGLAWSPDGRWLAAALEPKPEGSFHNGQTELVIFPLGPAAE